MNTSFAQQLWTDLIGQPIQLLPFYQEPLKTLDEQALERPTSIVV